MKNDQGFTHKEQLFMDIYLVNKFNGTLAAIEAFDIDMTDKELGENTASSIAYDLLRKPEIKEYIDNKLSAITPVLDEEWVLTQTNKLYNSSSSDGIKKDLIALVSKFNAMQTDKSVNTDLTTEDYLDNVVKDAVKSSEKSPESAKEEQKHEETKKEVIGE